MLALAADHVILDPELFHAACAAGREAAAAGHIVTFGIRPTAPKTSYGYIRRGRPARRSTALHAVAAFVEKPDAATAARYVAEGYLWNSGNFMFRADDAAGRTRPLRAGHGARPVEAAVARRDRPISASCGSTREAFARAPQKSIDYAVMERTDRAAVVEGRFRWSDIGSWDAVFDVSRSATRPAMRCAARRSPSTRRTASCMPRTG